MLILSIELNFKPGFLSGFKLPMELKETDLGNEFFNNEMTTLFFQPRIVAIGGLTIYIYIYIYGSFPKWWCPTNMSFPTKDDHLGVFWRYHHFWKHPYMIPFHD